MPVALTGEALASVLSQLSALENSLPDGPDLTSDERKRKRRIGESGAYEIAEMAALLRQTSTFLPGNFGQGAFVADAVGRIPAHRKRDSKERKDREV